jgi:hypothetical protein
MSTATQLILGAGACAAFVLLARRSGANIELRIYAAALVVAALIYVGFLVRGANAPWALVEVSGLALFALAALWGLRVSPLILASGWALHSGWDVLLHTSANTAFVPDWYPAVCAGFDLLLAVYIAARFKGKGQLRKA